MKPLQDFKPLLDSIDSSEASYLQHIGWDASLKLKGLWNKILIWFIVGYVKVMSVIALTQISVYLFSADVSVISIPEGHI